MVAAVAGSIGVAAGPGVDAAGAGCPSAVSFLPHPANSARAGNTQMASHFLVFMMSLHLGSNLKTLAKFTRAPARRKHSVRSMYCHLLLARGPWKRSLDAALR